MKFKYIKEEYLLYDDDYDDVDEIAPLVGLAARTVLPSLAIDGAISAFDEEDKKPTKTDRAKNAAKVGTKWAAISAAGDVGASAFAHGLSGAKGKPGLAGKAAGFVAGAAHGVKAAMRKRNLKKSSLWAAGSAAMGGAVGAAGLE